MTTCKNCGQDESAHVKARDAQQSFVEICPTSTFVAAANTDARDWTAYDGAFILAKPDGAKTSFHTIWQQSGHPPNAPILQYQSFVKPSPIAQVGDVCGVADWNGSWEYHRVPTATLLAGMRWGWIDGYGNASGAFWPAVNIRSDWVTPDGVVTNINPPPGVQGTPYAPLQYMPAGTYRRRTWFLWGGTTPSYEQVDLQYGGSTTNLSWAGTDKTQPVIRVWDAWYSNGQWADVATSPDHPFDDSGNPVIPNVTYGRVNDLGRGGGSFWSYDFMGYHVELQSIT